ncbi:MAG: FRG domain-containing protein [Planctomycetota bacterium]
METITLNSWADYATAISDIRNKYGKRTVGISGRELDNEILFRGQANSDWPLITTLERASTEEYSVQKYLQRADSCVNEIESVSGKQWGLKTYPEILREIENRQDSMRVYLPHYDYLVHLRHHGFPSPLLDWTTSPYIAAYFAFESAGSASYVSVYAFIETPEGHKSASGGESMIDTHGPYVTTHARHFNQKAWYTTATTWDSERNRHMFCSHHDVVPSPIAHQDVLIKLTLPRSDRITALRQLDDFNINHYSLFGTEDALVRTMSLRRFDIDES